MQAKTIFALWGTGGQGKSTAILTIAKEIQGQFHNATVQKLKGRNDLMLLIKIGDILIGIESQGDPGSRMDKSLLEFSKLDCGIIICATRTNGNTVKAVEAMTDKGYNIVWISNYSSDTNRDALNELFAKHVLELIQKYHSLNS